jgi:hypothetical protein
VREAEGFFLIEVPDKARKIVIVKAQVHGVMTLKKGGVVEKRGEEETKSMPHAPV